VYKIHPVFYLSFFLCFFTTIAGAQNPGDIIADNFEETAGRGLVIRTNPAGVRVFINGVESGVTPITFNSLAPGEYNIRLVRENYIDRVFDITLFAASRLVVSIKMEQPQGQVQLSVLKAENSPALLQFNPQVTVSSFGSIALDENYKADINLPAGFYTFRVQAFGWEDTAAAVLVTEDIVPVSIILKPAEFKIENLTQSRKRINPKNQNRLGVTEYRFEATAPGLVSLNIIDINETVVFKNQLNNIDTKIQRFTWDGRDSSGSPLPEGIYTVVISAGNTELKLETEINYSLNLFPASLNGGVSGLLFAPLPYTLPAGSFQIEADAVYGDFGSFTGFPFTFGLRISPIKNLEAAAVFNLNPQINDTGWGITGSVKYNLLHNLPVNLALGIFYSYADNNGEYPLSAGKGIGLYLPFSCKLFSGSLVSNTLVFSPGIFWHGPDKPVPALLLSAGYFLQYKDIYAGISARAELDLKNSSSLRFLAGAEARIFPVTSNLYFFLKGGVCINNSDIGGFGGLGIGVVY
jgi:hypothetical protein